MYYQLLTIKARDKAYITHTSDSLILEVLHYYEKKKDKKHLPEAYYYAGRIYRDLGDAPQALDYFFKAIDASSACMNYRLTSRIYSQIGTLYLYQEVYDKAHDVFVKAYQYAILAKDSISITYSLRDIGRTFSTLGKADSAIYYYKKADKLADKIKNINLKRIVNSELSEYYTKLGMYQKAYQSMQIAFEQINTINLAPRYCTAARYYYHTNQLDSATYYYTQLSLMNRYSYKAEGYQGLGYIARLKGEYKKALEYLDKDLAYTDSARNIIQTETVRKINSLYNYQLKEKENNRLKDTANNQKIWNIIFISFLISLILIFAVYWQYHKRKKQEELAQQRRIKRMQEEQYNQSLACIEENRRQIKKLEQSLQSAESIKSSLNQDLLNLQKKLIEKSNEQIIAKQEFREQGISILKKLPIYHKFLKAEQGIKIKKEDWQELTHSINEAYTDFTLRLLDLYPMKTIEMQVCLLIKIGVPPTQIAYITSHTKQAITSIRKRLYKKVFNMDGSPEDWDIFISSM
jgi:tetratricopeptide (TPR) repeat protein